MSRVLVLMLAVAGCVAAADPTDAVREAATGWRQGAIKQDATALERYCAPELVYTHGSGKRQTKAEYISYIMTGPPQYESFTDRGSAIRIYGKIAVLTGLVDTKMANTPQYQVRTFEVYVEHDGHWQLAQKESVRITR